MKASKTVGFYRLILSVVLIAMVVAVVGIAVDGWQQPSQDGTGGVPSAPSGGTQTPVTPPTDNPTLETPTPLPTPPAFVSYLTGLEVTEEASRRNPLAIVMNGSTGGYGLSHASIVMELPIENGSTRYLAYMESTDALGQVGTLMPSRRYLSDMLRSFGGLLVCYGNEDRVSYDGYDVSSLTLDLHGKQGCSYTEGLSDVYTNGYMLQNGLSGSMLSTEIYETPTLPFRFAEYGTALPRGAMEATELLLPYGSGTETELVYKESSGTYVLKKGGKTYTDQLTREAVEFTNVFVLFADATTYERTDMTQLVLDTKAGGAGFYASAGGAVRITWRTDEGGSIHFYDTAGRELTVNRGTSYISFFKSSMSTEVSLG